jgi:hypothetical protein
MNSMVKNLHPLGMPSSQTFRSYLPNLFLQIPDPGFHFLEPKVTLDEHYLINITV